MPINEEVTIERVFEEIVRTRNELKNQIQASEARLRLDFESLRKKVSFLERENTELRRKIELQDRNSRKNNLIVFGLENLTEEIPDTVCKEITKLLGINLTLADINNIFPLGRSNKCPIKIELISQLKKTLILQNSKKLKGTSVRIVQDLTELQREENKILRRHLKKAKETVTNSAYIKQNKLIVNNIVYTVEDLEPKDEEEEIENTYNHRTNSAPPTPSIQQQQFETPETESKNCSTTTALPNLEKSSLPCEDTPKQKKKLQENRTQKPIITKEKLRSYSTKEKSK